MAPIGALKRVRAFPPSASNLTYSIITTDPNELLEPIHNRMPVILSPQDYSRWLDPGEPSRLPLDLLRPFPAREMRVWNVSSTVGNVRNNGPELRLPTD